MNHAICVSSTLTFAASLGAALALAGCSSSAQDVGAASEAVSTAADPSAFVLPPSDPQARAQIVGNYAHLDPQGIVPRGLLEDAVEFFSINQSLIPNASFITVVDFSKYSGDYRLFIIDMKAGTVERG